MPITGGKFSKPPYEPKPASMAQISFIEGLAEKNGIYGRQDILGVCTKVNKRFIADYYDMTTKEASSVINYLKELSS